MTPEQAAALIYGQQVEFYKKGWHSGTFLLYDAGKFPHVLIEQPRIGVAMKPQKVQLEDLKAVVVTQEEGR
jgi:hypothetical protein